jgi:predicted metal-binding membrane protein
MAAIAGPGRRSTAAATLRGPGPARPDRHARIRERWLAGLLLALSAISWGLLAAWDASPYAGFLHRPGWSQPGALLELCASLPGGTVWLPATLHAASWTLMIGAMMLPTTYPLLALFDRVLHGRGDRRRLVAVAVGGFVLAWFAFGLAAHALDGLLVALAAKVPSIALNADYLAAAVLAGAGAFQFSALKYRCLEQCHSPFSFVSARWRGAAPVREAWRLGVDHGVFCIGCCWALMLLMFVVGVGSLGWMLALAVVMAAEKNLPWGRRLRAPLGFALVASAAALVLLRA